MDSFCFITVQHVVNDESRKTVSQRLLLFFYFCPFRGHKRNVFQSHYFYTFICKTSACAQHSSTQPPSHWVWRSRATFPVNIKHLPKVCSSTKNHLSLFDVNSFFFFSHFDLIYVTTCTAIEQDLFKMIGVYRMAILTDRKPAIWYNAIINYWESIERNFNLSNKMPI